MCNNGVLFLVLENKENDSNRTHTLFEFKFLGGFIIVIIIHLKKYTSPLSQVQLNVKDKNAFFCCFSFHLEEL